ncbi:SDR family NAD(P)-dependent oxidoreductase [Clostridium sp. DL1XJH146]
MSKTILITGCTDGIGLETAKMLVEMGHKVVVHGRNSEKVERVKVLLQDIDKDAEIDGFVADFSNMGDIRTMAETIMAKYNKIDVLINNAGVFVSEDTITKDGLELRFAVNTIAPYLLTKLLLPIMDASGRVVNLSSAAQSPVDIGILAEGGRMSDGDAYAQSKLALTMWSFQMAKDFKNGVEGPSVIAVNPKSFLGSKMVKKAYGTAGHDLRIGADILSRAALSDEFKDASGKYFDNDTGRFASPHPDALDEGKRKEIVNCIEEVLTNW